MEDANAGADQNGHHCRCQMGPEKTIHIVYCDRKVTACTSPYPFLNPPLIVDGPYHMMKHFKLKSLYCRE